MIWHLRVTRIEAIFIVVSVVGKQETINATQSTIENQNKVIVREITEFNKDTLLVQYF